MTVGDERDVGLGKGDNWGLLANGGIASVGNVEVGGNIGGSMCMKEGSGAGLGGFVGVNVVPVGANCDDSGVGDFWGDANGDGVGGVAVKIGGRKGNLGLGKGGTVRVFGIGDDFLALWIILLVATATLVLEYGKSIRKAMVIRWRIEAMTRWRYVWLVNNFVHIRAQKGKRGWNGTEFQFKVVGLGHSTCSLPFFSCQLDIHKCCI